MLNPSWVASGCSDVQKAFAFWGAQNLSRVEEGQKWPGNALHHSPHHNPSLIRPLTAKPASSQGGALALKSCEQTTPVNELHDMKMEFSS
jgi:hypothetical protein